jgi:hypothetical protein
MKRRRTSADVRPTDPGTFGRGLWGDLRLASGQEVFNMKVWFKDATATLLAALAAVVALAVINGWGWPLLSGYRAGTIALAVIGFGMCTVGSDYSTVRGLDPFVLIAGLLGVTALGLAIAGLIWATATLFVWLAVTILLLWLVTTVRHLLTPGGEVTPRAAAS